MTFLLRVLTVMLLWPCACWAQDACLYNPVNVDAGPVTALHADLDCLRWDRGRLEAAGADFFVQAKVGLTVPDAALTAITTGLQKADIATRELGEGIRAGRQVWVTATDTQVPGTRPTVQGEQEFDRNICFIYVYPSGLARDQHRIAQIVAHEYFHCIQSATLGRDYYADAADETAEPGRRPQDWFLEGAPEWFAFLAIADAEPGWALNWFELRADHADLSGMSYAGWVFFAWYAERHDAAATMALIRRLRREHGEVGAINALLDPDEWHDFARSYAAFQIRRRDRQRVVPDTRQPRPPIDIDEDAMDRGFVSELGVFSRRQLVFAPGTWELSPGEGPPRYISRLLPNGDPDGSWKEVTEGLQITTRCGQPEPRVLLGYGTDPAEPTYLMRFTRVANSCDLPCASVPTTRDQCLVGRWEDTGWVPPDSSVMPGVEVLEMDHPAPVYTFYADGRFRNDNAFYSDVIARDGANWMQTLTNFDVNASLGHWGSDGTTLKVCETEEVAHGWMQMNTSARPGSPGPLNFDKNLEKQGEERELTFSYECSGDTLLVRSGFLGIVRGEFRRLDPLPEVATEAAPGDADEVPLLPEPPSDAQH